MAGPQVAIMDTPIPFSYLAILWFPAIAFVVLSHWQTRREVKATRAANEANTAVITHLKNIQEAAAAESRTTIASMGASMQTALAGVDGAFHELQKHSRAMQVGQMRDMTGVIQRMTATSGHFQLKLLQTFLLANQHKDGADPKALMDGIERIATQEIHLGEVPTAEDIAEKTTPPSHQQ